MSGSEAVDGARALIAWWALAGVDAAVAETPRAWLAPAGKGAGERAGDRASARARAVSPDSGGIAHDGAYATADTGPASAITANAMPSDLASLHDWLAADPMLPEAKWGGARLLPTGSAGPTLMIITDMPDPADAPAGMLFADESRRLFDDMLRAIGHSRASIYLASLALSRPPGGSIGADDAALLAARMRRHIALVGPKRVLILGDKTSRALPTTNGAAGGVAGAHGLRGLNHDGGTVDAIATFHPRFLLRQPAAKAQTWAALRILIEDA